MSEKKFGLFFKTMAHESGVIELEFCNGDRCPSEAFMLCDKEDEALLRRWTWIWMNGYARNNTGRQGRCAHQIIMGDPPTPGLSIDHINGCGTDNRRINLRWATKAEQTANRRRRGRNRACKSHWRDIWIDKNGQYHYNYDQYREGPFSSALECRERMDTLSS